MIGEYPEEWIKCAKLALSWFGEAMGEDEWADRKRNVVRYFNDIHENEFHQNLKPAANEHSTINPNKPYAIYDDWIAWYMYLVDSLFDRPGCDEPMQSSRIYPIFAAIGRRLALAKSIIGVEARLAELVGRRRNQADSTLYELVVAICYRRNGWDVEFIPEAPPEKRPDFLATRGGENTTLSANGSPKLQNIQSWSARLGSPGGATY